MKLKLYGENPKLWQWDTGRRLIVEDGGGCDRAYFGRKGLDSAPVVPIRLEGGLHVVDIPNSILLVSGNFTAYLYDCDDEGNQTWYEQTFYVNQCPKPDTYVYSETEVLSYASLDERLSSLESEGLAAAVEDYLKENPVQSGTTPVKGVDYFTDAEVQQIAQQAAGMVEVPAGADKTWKSLTTVTIDNAETSSVEVSGFAVAFEEFAYILYLAANFTNATGIQTRINDFYTPLSDNQPYIGTGNRYYTVLYTNGFDGYYACSLTDSNSATTRAKAGVTSVLNPAGYEIVQQVNKINVYTRSGEAFPKGTKFEFFYR